MKINNNTIQYGGHRETAGLFQPQQPLYEIRVRMADNTLLGHIALAFLGFLCKDVTFEGLLVSDLACAGNLKPFLGTRVRFDLGHFGMLYL